MRTEHIGRWIALAWWVWWPDAAAAQSPPDHAFREAVTLPVSSAVERKLAPVADFLQDGQWDRAIDILSDVARDHAEDLIRVSVGHYVHVGTFCQMQLARLPAEGLAAYRRRIDPLSQKWYEAGRDRRDERLLRKIVREAFAGSYGDEALLLLGDWAWERGDIAAARQFWRQLLPVGPEDGRPAPAVLRYPDADLPRAEVVARLVLADVWERRGHFAESLAAQYRETFPDAVGHLAGAGGNLADLLDAVRAHAEGQSAAVPCGDAATFAGNPQRNGRVEMSALAEVGPPLWEVRVPAEPLPVPAAVRPPPLAHGLYPVGLGDLLLFCDAHRIYAFNVRTGQPYWPRGEGDTSGVIYSDLDELTQIRPVQPCVGTPRYTLTVERGRVYARMGSPVTMPAAGELRRLSNELVCLDVAARQGELQWKLSAADLPEGWVFDGAPVVEDGRLFVALRRNRPQTEFGVGCFEAHTGALLWRKAIGVAVHLPAAGYNHVTYQLLTLGGGLVFASTEAGAIAGLDADDGTVLWAATYASRGGDAAGETSVRRQGPLIPCVYDGATLYAAPPDSDRILALDAASGLLRWTQELPQERVRHLLGVSSGGLFVGGEKLWGLDARTGRLLPAWKKFGPVGFSDPAGYGSGRGLLVDHAVWWPTREEIFVVHQATREILQRIALLDRYGEAGGNLAVVGGQLVVAQPERVVVFGTASFSRR